MDSKKISEELIQFIWDSPSSFHTIANVEKQLREAGYVQLREKEKYELVPGGRYYVTRNDSSLLAFQIPQGEAKGFRIIASHSDTPGFKLKEDPERTEKTYVKLNIEKYGGMILSTWLDRPLSVAGRAVVRGEAGLESRLVNFEENLCMIPNVAIHFNRDINKGFEYNPQVDMQPLFGMGEDIRIKKKTAELLRVKEEDILGMDLFLYNRERGTFFGCDSAFVGAPRLDDTQCVFASLQGLLQASPGEYINICAVFDNEEVGSCTRQGADSDFLEVNLHRIARALGRGEELPELLADSFLLSADNGHALHPNHPEKSDPVNAPLLNGGVVIKYHGNQKYTTDAYTGAVVKDLCLKEGIPYQTFHNRADIAGGSTLGNISISHLSISSADIGLPQLAMHSAFETTGAEDTAAMVRLAKRFFDGER